MVQVLLKEYYACPNHTRFVAVAKISDDLQKENANREILDLTYPKSPCYFFLAQMKFCYSLQCFFNRLKARGSKIVEARICWKAFAFTLSTT